MRDKEDIRGRKEEKEAERKLTERQMWGRASIKSYQRERELKQRRISQASSVLFEQSERLFFSHLDFM